MWSGLHRGLRASDRPKLGRTVALLLGTGALLAGCAVPVSRAPAPRGSPVVQGSGDLRIDEMGQRRLEDYRERLARVSRRLMAFAPGRPEIRFAVAVGNPQINAGASSGQVVVTSGLLDFVRDDDELAAVLGHEIAHITEGHVTQGMVGGVALTALAILVDSQAPGLGQLAAGGGQLFLNRFTQSQEREADRVGLELVYRAGFDPLAAARVQERMAVAVPETTRGGYFSTHPSSHERKDVLRRQAEQLLASGPPPGRAEVVARSSGGGRPGRRDAATSSYRDARREAPREDVSLACRRAENYVRQAEESRTRSDRERYYRRALRYCPSLHAAREGLERLRRE